MTCIVGIVHERTVYMGADSLAGSMDVCIMKQPKLLKLSIDKGIGEYEMMVGVAGSPRVRQLIKSVSDESPLEFHGEESYYWLIARFVPWLRNACGECGLIVQHPEYGETINSDMLVGLRGRLFHIDGMFQVMEPACHYFATGSGGPYALGSLFATGSFSSMALPPVARLEMALTAVEVFSGGVRRPFVFESLEEW